MVEVVSDTSHWSARETDSGVLLSRLKHSTSERTCSSELE